ncbi:MAG: NAD(P)H-dependent oxidoreductase [Candidatus Woesearchaeota archaeon]
MNILIIYAHPKKSDCHAAYTLEKITAGLKAKALPYTLIDLYAEGFNPALSEQELGKQEGTYALDPQVASYQKKIKEADILIFIYPIWWNSMPAILKGFFDRVFTARFAFYYYKGIPRPLLKGKKAFVFVTTGAPKLLSFIFMGNRFVPAIAKDILSFCGISSTVYHTGSARALTEVQKAAITKKVNSMLKKIA